MGFFENAITGLGMIFSNPQQINQPTNLKANTREMPKTTLPWKAQSITQTQSDIKTWKNALSMYFDAEEPKNFALQALMRDIMNDSLLSSQIENRNNQLYSVDWSIKSSSGEVDDEQTARLKKSPAFRKITNAILNARYLGYSLLEISLKLTPSGDFDIKVIDIPRENVVPKKGKFYFDYAEDKFILYRKLQEFGTTILEFDFEDVGLINKAIPHALFKRFAMSCWSELCEIHGIPPRFMKTNTQDTKMLDRAEKMMQDMGSAAWFIIDNHEEFEFAQGISTKGEVYESLIKLCSNEMSMLISGAIIGQDTKNGSNAKETVSQEILATLVKADLEMTEQSWNQIVIPALIKLGFLTGDVHFEFDPSEDVAELWNRTKEMLPYAEFDDKGIEWIRTKFGVEISSLKKPTQTQLGFGPDFFA